MWSNIETLRLISHGLMWAAAVFAILAAFSTGFRYYVDRQVSRLSSTAQKAAADIQHQEQIKREAALKAELEDARAIAKRLEERQTPRKITPAQRAKFLAALKDGPKGKLSVYSFMSADPGTIQYANQIRDMIVAAGFDSGVMVGMGMGGPIPVGAAISVKEEKNQPPFAGAVQRAFIDAQIPLKAIIDPTIAPDEVRVVIGLKPE